MYVQISSNVVHDRWLSKGQWGATYDGPSHSHFIDAAGVGNWTLHKVLFSTLLYIRTASGYLYIERWGSRVLSWISGSKGPALTFILLYTGTLSICRLLYGLDSLRLLVWHHVYGLPHATENLTKSRNLNEKNLAANSYHLCRWAMDKTGCGRVLWI